MAMIMVVAIMMAIDDVGGVRVIVATRTMAIGDCDYGSLSIKLIMVAVMMTMAVDEVGGDGNDD